MDDDQPPAESTGVDYRQVSFLLLAAIALLVAALLAPGLVAEPSADESSIDDGDEAIGEGGDAREEDPDSVDWTEVLEWLGLLEESEATPPEAPPCTIYVHGDPTPGDEQTVTIEYEGEPLADAQVWFESQPIGTTDDQGQVTGEVPYVESVTIRVETDGGVECLAVESGPTITLEESSGFSGAVQDELAVSTNRPTSRTMTASATSAAVVQSEPRNVAAGQSEPQNTAVPQTEPQNATAEYAVDGDVELVVEGVPDPGAELTLEATIDDVPMTAAEVTVDGEDTGETDEAGSATVTVPDDGTERLEVAVSRGDFTGETTLEVRLLEASLTPDGLAPIPGSDGVVVAERAGEPVPAADVAVGGDDAGETDEAGTTPVSIPRDPTAPVTVRTGDQTAQTTLLEAYGLVALATVLLLGVVAGGSYRTHGTRGPVGTVALAASLVAVLVVEAFYGPLAGLLALAALVVVGLSGGLSRSDRTITVGVSTQAERGRGLLERLLSWTLTAASWLETRLEQAGTAIGQVTSGLVSLARTARGHPRRGIAWLTSLPGYLLVVGHRLVGVGMRVRSVETGQLLAATVGLALLSLVGYAVDGALGGLVALLAGTVALIGVSYLRRRPANSQAQNGDGSSPVDGSGAGDGLPGPDRHGSSDEPRPVRIVWRAFARQVAPVEWRTRAPVEIERRAIDRGYPPAPVGDLTSLFRAVEYGSETETRADRERAEEALEAIERSRRSERRDGTADRVERSTTDRSVGDEPAREAGAVSPSGSDDGPTRANDDDRTPGSDDGPTRGGDRP